MTRLLKKSGRLLKSPRFVSHGTKTHIIFASQINMNHIYNMNFTGKIIRTKRAALGISAAVWLIPTAVSAQDAAQSPWTLQDCIDYALEHNLELRQKKIATEQSQVDIKAAKGALFPSLSFATNQNVSWRPWSNSYVNITDGALSSTNSTVNYNGSYGLQAQWTVWDGGITHKKYARSKLANEQSSLDEEATGLSIQEQIIQAYTQILYQTSAVDVNKQILESTKTLCDRAKTMYETGTMSRADYVQMEAQVSQEEYNVTNAQTQLAEFKLQLKTLLEIVDTDEMDVAVPSISDDRIMSALPSVKEVYAYASSNRPEMRAEKLAVELADMDISIAKRGYYPTIALSAGINTNSASGLDQSWYNQIKENLSNSVGLTVSVPIFDKRQNSTNVSRAKLDKESALVNLEMKSQQLYSDIEGYWLNATNAQQQYASALKNAASMRESYQLVSEQFAVGLKDIVDLTTGKNNLIQAEQQMLQSKYTAVLNRAILDFYNGSELNIE